MGVYYKLLPILLFNHFERTKKVSGFFLARASSIVTTLGLSINYLQDLSRTWNKNRLTQKRGKKSEAGILHNPDVRLHLSVKIYMDVKRTKIPDTEFINHLKHIFKWCHVLMMSDCQSFWSESLHSIFCNQAISRVRFFLWPFSDIVLHTIPADVARGQYMQIIRRQFANDIPYEILNKTLLCYILCDT